MFKLLLINFTESVEIIVLLSCMQSASAYVMDYNNTMTTDTHMFLIPTFETMVELWSHKRHWAPNEHQLQTNLSNKPSSRGTAITNLYNTDLNSLYLCILHPLKYFSVLNIWLLIRLLLGRLLKTTLTSFSHYNKLS